MKTFLISRTDAIGDVVLTLPLCGWIKEVFPGANIVFLGRTYTEPVLACCRHVDKFINADALLKLPEAEQINILQELQVEVFLHVYPDRRIAQLAQRAKVPVRVGTRNRWFHWLTCNRVPALSRRHSPLHESQLNLLLLQGMGMPEPPLLCDLPGYYGFDQISPLPARYQELLSRNEKLNIILHPKSRGSGREWELSKFGEVAGALHQQGHQVFVTGSPQERELLGPWLQRQGPVVNDLTGQLSLAELISFIAASDGLVAASTGPLHLAAAAGVHALGLFPPLRPVHPGRWAPVGERASFMVLPKDCEACRKEPGACWCINQISVEAVLQTVTGWEKRTI